jgi:hypothetical protein
MLLSKSERFLNEYKTFSEKISRITDERIKNDLTQLLNNLVNAVKSIDQQHQELVAIHRMPEAIGESQSNLLSIRKKIFEKISQAEKAGLIK